MNGETGDRREPGTEDWLTSRKATWEGSKFKGKRETSGPQTQVQCMLAPWPGPALSTAAKSQLETHTVLI